MSERTKGGMHIVGHSWRETGLYVGERRIALLEIDEECNEDEQEGLEQEMMANARHLAACWNAQESVDIAADQLEQIADVTNCDKTVFHRTND